MELMHLHTGTEPTSEGLEANARLSLYDIDGPSQVDLSGSSHIEATSDPVEVWAHDSSAPGLNGVSELGPVIDAGPVSRPRGRPRTRPPVYGPKRKRGRPPKERTEKETNQAEERPAKKARSRLTSTTQLYTVELGKFRLPRTQPRLQITASRQVDNHLRAQAQQSTQPAESANQATQPAVRTSPPLNHTIIESEDQNRVVEELNNSEDLGVDGTGIGMEDEVYDRDNNQDDDVVDEDFVDVAGGNTPKESTLVATRTRRTLPPWLMQPFQEAVDESRKRDNNGLPPLYQKSTFWFPTSSSYFILRSWSHVSPSKLYCPRFFLWDPQALYKIPCPGCAKSLNRDRHIPHPRRCIDINSSFWIIGYRYRCRNCINPRTGQRLVTYRSWDPRIMKLLPAELAAEFPACLSHRSGISKQLFELMRSTFQNGLGSGQFSDLLRVQHLLAYDNVHLQYLNHLLSRQQNLDRWVDPESGYPPFLPFDDISDEGCHGYTPSSAWLRDMYDSYIEKHQSEFNQHMSMLTGEICAIDHSHKVTKHVARVEGEQVFTALLTVTNEKGEIRICNFVATKSHSQFEDALIRMRTSLSLYGHSQPQLFYTDNMADKYLLESSFPSLRNDVSPLEKYAHLSPLEPFHDGIQILTKDTSHSINQAISTILDDVPEDDGEIVVGFDAEWNVELSPQGFVRSRSKAAILQIAYKKRIYVLQISSMLARSELPHELAIFLSHPRIHKVGRLISSDIAHLERATGKPPGTFCGALDVARLAKDRYVISKTTNISLADLSAIVLQKRLDKNTSLRVNQSWENRVLSDEQVKYAAKDAYASLLIYERLIRDFIEPAPLLITTPALTPVLLYSTNSRTVVAEGVLSRSSNLIYDGITISPTHTIVDIHRVLIPGALITSHRRRSLESFGHPPFTLVCYREQVRTYLPTQLQNQSTPLPAPPSNASVITEPAPEQSLVEDDVDEMISVGDSMSADISGPTLEIAPLTSVSNTTNSDTTENLDYANHKLGPDQLLGSMQNPTEWDDNIHSRVLKDVWHIFHMIYIPVTHGLRKQFTRELRDVVFIPDKEDRERINAWGSTQKPPQTYSMLRNSSPEWTRTRCRHTIPPPHILYPLVRKVFCTYGPLIDPTTKQHLFSNNTQWQMARNILDLIRKGFVSDPPGISLYTRMGIDKKSGLPMYRCTHGTNATEGGVHTHIRARLPKFGVSIRHVQASLLDFTLRHNLLVGTYNSTGRPYRGHFSIWTINRIHELLTRLKDTFSKPIQLNGWINGNMYVQTSEVIGILPIPDEVRTASGIAPYHPASNKDEPYSFMASMQNTRKAILPVHTAVERELFRSLIETEPAFSPTSGDPHWNDAVVIWNEKADGRKGIYYKLVEHLKAYYAKWKTLLQIKNALSLTSEVRQPLTRDIHNPNRSSIAPPVPTMDLQLPQVTEGRREPDATGSEHVEPAVNSRRFFPDSTLHQPPDVSLTTKLTDNSRLTHQMPIHTVGLAKQQRPRTCRKCALPDCKGKRAVIDCRNKCQDCGRFECQGRNSRKLHLKCMDGWD